MKRAGTSTHRTRPKRHTCRIDKIKIRIWNIRFQQTVNRRNLPAGYAANHIFQRRITGKSRTLTRVDIKFFKTMK